MKVSESETPDGSAQVHNVRFYTIKPRAIICMALSKALKFLAVGRDDGSIELWNMHHSPYLDRIIRMTPEKQAESLVWASKRLFSVNLMGQLIEWDVNSLQPRYRQSPTGYALWCLDVNRAETELAVGSEEGHINIMSIENDELNYKTLFNKQSGRVLCCKFDRQGKRLVTGSVGAVRIWSVAKGHVLHTMTLSDKNVVVYALQVLSDNTIIAGDSAGFVTFWNGKNATQLETNKVLDSKVFALAINKDEDRLICSGMDPPLIRVLNRTKIKREDTICERWIRYLQREVHHHYVKSLIVIGNRIISGGEDGILCISSCHKAESNIVKYAPFLQGPCASLAPSANLLLLRYPQSLHLWTLGTPLTGEPPTVKNRYCAQLQLDQVPLKLLQINVGATKFIQAAAISPDNAWICYSTVDELRMSRLQQNPLAVERLTDKELPEELEAASFIVFNKVTSEQMFLFHPNSRQVRCFDLRDNQVRFLFSLDLGAEFTGPVNHMILSPCGSYLVLATSNGLVGIWKLDPFGDKQAEHLLNLPQSKACVTALAVHEQKPVLVVAYADWTIMEYDLEKRHFVSESHKHFLESSKDYCIRGILTDAQNPNVIIVYNELQLLVLQSCRPVPKMTPHAPQSKMKRLSLPNGAVDVSKPNTFQLTFHLYRQHLVDVSRLSPDELVTISIQPRNLIASLPPPYVRKKFGMA